MLKDSRTRFCLLSLLLLAKTETKDRVYCSAQISLDLKRKRIQTKTKPVRWINFCPLLVRVEKQDAPATLLRHLKHQAIQLLYTRPLFIPDLLDLSQSLTIQALLASVKVHP